MEYLEIINKVLTEWYVKFAEFTPNLIVGILVFLFFLYTSKFLSRSSLRIFQKLFPKSRNQDTIEMLIGFFRFLIILIATFISLEIMGLSGFFIKFIGSLGVAGIIAGVALKDIVSSMFSGMLVSVDKAFKVGDTVQISNITGKVVDIGFLTTKLIAEDGRKYYLPNQQIFNSPFINFSASTKRKVMIDIEVSHTADLDKVRHVLLDELCSFSFVHNPEEADVIFVKQKLGAYSLQARFNTSEGENIVVAKSHALVKFKERLDKEGIDTSAPATS